MGRPYAIRRLPHVFPSMPCKSHHVVVGVVVVFELTHLKPDTSTSKEILGRTNCSCIDVQIADTQCLRDLLKRF